MTIQTFSELNIIAINGGYVEYDGQRLCPDAIYDDCKYPNLNESALFSICVGNYVKCPTRRARVLRGVANDTSFTELRISQDQVNTREKIRESQTKKPKTYIGGKF